MPSLLQAVGREALTISRPLRDAYANSCANGIWVWCSEAPGRDPEGRPTQERSTHDVRETRSATNGAQVLHVGPLEPLGVDAVVTTREGGVSTGPYRSLNLALHVGDEPSKVVENRRRALASLGANLEDLVLGEQVHGTEVSVVDGSARGRGVTTLADAVPSADAIVTADPGTVLGVLVADCVPIVVVDPGSMVLACIHAGWRGTAGAVVERALAAMAGLGARPDRLVAYLGPAVAASRYQVDRPVIEAIRRRIGGDDPAISPDGPERWHLDLPAVNRRILAESGVSPERIHSSPLTTSDPRFYSHRGAGGRACGRFALLARLRP
jgi:purine-nucleoside/S-methyl-5'-thioadenosine phosphorylase / adenosine deaminase